MNQLDKELLITLLVFIVLLFLVVHIFWYPVLFYEENFLDL